MAKENQAAAPEQVTRAEMDELKQLVETQNELLKEATSHDEEPVIEVLSDPYEQDAFSVEAEIPADQAYPEGQALCWVNAALRDRAGSWKDWQPLQWGDEYTGENGERLREYGIVPPQRVHYGSSKLDSYVRYGDVLLCRCDKRSVERRRKIASLRGQNRVMGTAAPVRAGKVTIEGPGHKRGRPLS